MSAPEICVWIAAVIHASGYYVYNRNIRKKENRPSAVTWGIATGVAVVNAYSFWQIDTATWYQAVPSVVGAIAAIYTFRNTLSSDHTLEIVPRDIVIAVICSCALVFLAFDQPAYASYVLTCALVLGSWRILSAVYSRPNVERPHPWMIWFCSYGTLLGVTIYTHQWERVPVLVVVVTMFAVIAFLSRSSRFQRQRMVVRAAL